MSKEKAPRVGPRGADYTNKTKIQEESITSPHDPSNNNQTDDTESLKRRLKKAKAIDRDRQDWISRRWGRIGEESIYCDPRTGLSLRFTRETFDCGEILTVSNLDEPEKGGSL
jgi:hypothetical protein